MLNPEQDFIAQHDDEQEQLYREAQDDSWHEHKYGGVDRCVDYRDYVDME
jgi:hypothetical protein